MHVRPEFTKFCFNLKQSGGSFMLVVKKLLDSKRNYELKNKASNLVISVIVLDTDTGRQRVEHIRDLVPIFGVMEFDDKLVINIVSDLFWKSLDYFENVEVEKLSDLDYSDRANDIHGVRFNNRELETYDLGDSILFSGDSLSVASDAFIIRRSNDNMGISSLDLFSFVSNILISYPKFIKNEKLIVYSFNRCYFNKIVIDLPEKLKRFIVKARTLQ